MNFELRGKLALVTGSSRGLGKAIAQALAQEGVEVIINGQHGETVLKTASEIRDQYNVRTWPCIIDAKDDSLITSYFQSGPIADRGSLDILINNIGNVEKFGKFNDLTDEDWFTCFDLAVMSMVRFTRTAIPLLEKSGNGRIINISSLSSHQPGNSNPHYVAAKAAINSLTKQLATNLGSKNILVNAVCPSTLEGGGWHENIKNRATRENISYDEAMKIMQLEEFNKSPLRRMGGLQDVADLIVFLASDKANFLTGHIYNVDGGITKGI